MSSTKTEIKDEDMQFGSEGDQNSVDSFEQQLQQQEKELQSVLRQQEQEDLAKKAAESTNATAAAPEPVSAPAVWQESNVPETMDTTNGLTDQTHGDGADDQQPAATTTTSVVVGVKRSSPCPSSQENGDPSEEGDEDGKDDKQPAAKQRKVDEFGKLWNAVQETPKDFQAWTMLLQHVDQQSELESGRDSYAAFFARYPYCYGYWKKFADLEKRKGTQESTLKVFEQGLEAIPLSVDLWVHYLDYITHTFSEPDQEDFVRKQFDRAVEACGLEFRSDKMWDAYITWENSNKRLLRVTAIYDKLLATPVAKYMQHWTKFQDHVKKHSSVEVVPADEFLTHRRSLRAAATDGAVTEAADPDAEVDEAPPGVEDDGDAPGDISMTVPTVANEEENKNIQQLIISAREKVHQSTSDDVKQRWSFEDAIKRPYFHVKPLERSQLQAWRDYLEYESKQGNERRTRTLFERCLIAAALYEEFWMRYLHYLETLSAVTPDDMRSVYERACTIHLRDKLKPHLSWANFEEENGNANRALELLAELQSRLPEALEPHLQAVALERRRGNLEKAQELFESSLATFKEKAGTGLTVGYGNLLIKYARFLALFRGKSEQAVTVLQTALDDTLESGMKLSEPEQQSLEALLWSIIEFALACSPPNLVTAASALKTGTGPHFSPRIRLVFGHRYHQFVAECGHPGVSVSESTKLLRDLQQELRQLESAQDDCMDETLSEKAADNASNSSEHRRERRSGGSKSYSSSHNGDKSQQQQQNFSHQSGGHNHQQNGSGGGNMGGGGGGGSYNQPPSGGGAGGGNYQQYPPQTAAGGGAPPPHQPPQHPPPQGQGQHQGYGNYNQNYQQQGYPPQQYQGWGYPQHQGGYGYNQQGWPGYPNYYGQR